MCASVGRRNRAHKRSTGPDCLTHISSGNAYVKNLVRRMRLGAESVSPIVILRPHGQIMVTSVRAPSIQYVLAILMVGVAAIATRVLWHFNYPAFAPLFIVAV